MKPLRYLLRFANKKNYNPSDARNILIKCRQLAGEKITVGDVRVSSAAIEVDSFIPKIKGEVEVAQSIAKILGPIISIRQISDLPTGLTKEEFLRRGIELFNQERFWECHEFLEAAWKKEKGEERDLIQSIILAAAAFVHYQKNQNRVALSVIERALSKMKLDAQAHYGIDIAKLSQDLNDILRKKKISIFKIQTSSY